MTWPKVRVGDITHLVTKGTTPTKDQGFAENGVNFIKAEALNGDSALDPKGIFHISEGVHQKLKRSILQEDDVLLTIAGAQIGKCGHILNGAKLGKSAKTSHGRPRILNCGWKPPVLRERAVL